MPQEDQFFRTLPEEELWQRYCGFLNLSVDEFMEIQEHLLEQQIDLVADSTLGKKIMGGNKPGSVEEFRRIVPLTTYEDYEPYLSERQNDALAVKPIEWCHSSGRGGSFKWIPYTAEALEESSRLFVSYLILATANHKGDIRIHPGERVIMHIPPKGYASWTFCYHAARAFAIRLIPSLEEAEGQELRDRIQKGFQIALRSGVDEIASISSVMVKVGERMAEEAQGMRLSPFMLQPQVAFRFARGWLRSKLEKRAMLPKDLWSPKCIITGGTDTSIYKESVAYYWGKIPFEMYGASEVPTIAVQNWTKKWLTFIPYFAFWEFIPEEESRKSREDKDYKPKTLLLNELEPGNIYEVVLTHFHGMPFMRYRIGDAIQVMAMRDDEAGVNLPQITFHSRVGETIDLAGLTRLTERVIWQAIVNTGIKHEDWAACKEYDEDKAFLRLYIEMKEERDTAEIEHMIDKQLKSIDPDYRDLNSYLEFQPIRITVLSQGTFERFYQEKVKEGADLAHLKPPHMNAPEAVIRQLAQLSI
jgi:hypothetical protein